MNALDLLSIVTLRAHRDACKASLPPEVYAEKMQKGVQNYQLIATTFFPDMTRLNVVRVVVTKAIERKGGIDELQLALLMAAGVEWLEQRG